MTGSSLMQRFRQSQTYFESLGYAGDFYFIAYKIPPPQKLTLL